MIFNNLLLQNAYVIPPSMINGAEVQVITCCYSCSINIVSCMHGISTNDQSPQHASNTN